MKYRCTVLRQPDNLPCPGPTEVEAPDPQAAREAFFRGWVRRQGLADQPGPAECRFGWMRTAEAVKVEPV